MNPYRIRSINSLWLRSEYGVFQYDSVSDTLWLRILPSSNLLKTIKRFGHTDFICQYKLPLTFVAIKNLQRCQKSKSTILLKGRPQIIWYGVIIAPLTNTESFAFTLQRIRRNFRYGVIKLRNQPIGANALLPQDISSRDIKFPRTLIPQFFGGTNHWCPGS